MPLLQLHSTVCPRYQYPFMVLPGNTGPGSVGNPCHVKFRFTEVPLVEKLVHLLLFCDPMKSLLFSILPFLFGACDEGWMGKKDYGVLPDVLKELYHTFPGKVTRMQYTGFVKELLLHVEVVAPVPCLQEAGIVIKTRLDEASQ